MGESSGYSLPWAIAAAVLLTLIEAAACSAQPRQDQVRFNRDIRPILADHCFRCHGLDKTQRQAKLRLDQRAEAIADRRPNAAIVPGRADQSELFRRITHADPDERMPPSDTGPPLQPSQIALIKRWIDQGADYETHWSFTPPQRPVLLQVTDPNWARNPIDVFVLARLDRAGLRPSPPARRETLIRRVTFDLTGLPPTIEEIDAFLRDDAPDAFERLVDRLLSSPSYGEHMAVGWLDAARYADTNGYNNDTPRYNWRWRDWVIDALNENMPFDRFATEQLAGDLLPEATLSQIVATGFNRNHNVTSEGGIIDEEYRLEYVADRVQTTATVFMALTMRCARCHDHKFDPISQREYYQFFAFFNQVPEQGYHKEHKGNVNPVIEAPTSLQQDALRKCRAELESVTSQLGALREDDPEHHPLASRRDVLQQAEKAQSEKLPTAMIMRDLSDPRDTFVLERGAYDRPREKVSPGTPQLLPSFPAQAPRNRLGLAEWLTRPDHPLTARVTVNRLWCQVFGRGIVETLEDFGTQGAWPSHPDLLDWLATELVRSGWDVKAMLRLMVNSATYRQSSRVAAELLAVDPENRLLARGPRFRMTAEMIRDNALAASGLMDHGIGGPSVKPYQPPGLWTEVSVADDSYSGGPFKQDHGAALYRRSLYTWWKRTCPPPALNTLDAPDREFCTVARTRTNTPLQALVLMNDPTFVEAARVMAERVLTEGGATAESRAAFAFRLATARKPTRDELAVILKTLDRQVRRFQQNPAAAEKLVAIGDSKPKKPLDTIPLAAWTTVASMILNLDEVITKQ